MFSIFKKKKYSDTDLSALVTDMHSHILPGIDDGSPDTETSLVLIKGLQDLGYQNFIATPHIFHDLYKNDADSITEARQQLEAALAQHHQPLPVKAAAEYFLDDHFDRLLREDTPLLTLRDKLVLVEFSFVSITANYKEQLFNLQIKGYQPVLAHPERYLYLAGHKAVFDELRSAGCLFQVNLLSLAGYYGKAASDLAHYLIRQGYVDLLGTDLHHIRHLEALRRNSPLMDQVSLLLDSGNLLNPTLYPPS